MPEFDRKAIDEISTNWAEEYSAGPGDAASFAMALEGAVGYGYRRGLEDAAKMLDEAARKAAGDWNYAHAHGAREAAKAIRALMETPGEGAERDAGHHTER